MALFLARELCILFAESLGLLREFSQIIKKLISIFKEKRYFDICLQWKKPQEILSKFFLQNIERRVSDFQQEISRRKILF